jgi:ribose 5-phosphate isomerase B
MNPITLAFASDHAGYAMKEMLKTYAKTLPQVKEVIDLGTHGTESVHYPDYGLTAAEEVVDGKADMAVIICGSGIGISIAANRVKGARAALCHNGLTARLSRQHNDANLLALGARIVGDEVAKDCLQQFVTTPFEGGRHKPRVEMLG